MSWISETLIALTLLTSAENPQISDENLIILASGISEKNPIQIDISKLPHTASNWDKLILDILMQSWKIRKELLINIIKEVQENSNYLNVWEDEDNPQDEKDFLLSELKLKIKAFDKEWIQSLLEDYEYNQLFINGILEVIPKKLAIVPKITTEELVNLATLDYKDVIQTYIKTWKIPKWFELFEEGLKEIKVIIEEKEAIIDKWNKSDKLRIKIEKMIDEMRKLKSN